MQSNISYLRSTNQSNMGANHDYNMPSGQQLDSCLLKQQGTIFSPGCYPKQTITHMFPMITNVPLHPISQHHR